MATAIEFDKRLYDRYFKSNELTRDELRDYVNALPDLTDQIRYRQTEDANNESEATDADQVSDSGESTAGSQNSEGE